MLDAQPRRDANGLVLRGKAVELAEAELVELFQRVGYRPSGDEAVSPTLADESAVASLPRGPDKVPMEAKGPLGQERTHLRSMPVKG